MHPPNLPESIRYFYTFLPVWITCLLSIIWYKLAINKISSLQCVPAGTELYVLMIYPGINVICQGPALITQTVIQFGAAPPSNTVITIFTSLVNLQRLFDAVVYRKSIKRALKDSFNKCFRNKLSDDTEERTFVEPYTVIRKRVEHEHEHELSSSNYLGLSSQYESSTRRKHP